jgi:hypothetical protein
MASASKYGGASYTEAELADPSPPVRPVRVRRPELGLVDREPYLPDEEEESPSPGGDSTQSSESNTTSESKSKAVPRKAAPTTANRSKAQVQAEDSIVRSTGGAGRSKATQQSDDFDF